jgi:hypothetical protein
MDLEEQYPGSGEQILQSYGDRLKPGDGFMILTPHQIDAQAG